MKRVNRSSILSSVSLKASRLENTLINAIDKRSQSEKRDQQAPAISEPNYYPTMTWDAKSKQAVRSWTF